MKKRLVVWLFLLWGGALSALNHQAVLDLDSPVYDYIETLYLECGLALPSQSKPWSEEEARFYLARVDRRRLSRSGRILYEEILSRFYHRRLYREESGFSFNAAPSVCLQSYSRLELEGEAARAPQDYVWQFGYESRAPFFTLPLEFGFGSFLYGNIEASLREDRRVVDNQWTPASHDTALVTRNYTNIPNEEIWLDMRFPAQAYLNAGGGHWSVQLGRDQVNWGNGNSGNMLLSDNADYYDFLSVSTWWEAFNFSLLYAVMDPYREVNPEELPKDFDDPSIRHDSGYKAFLAHRFVVRPFPILSLSLTESIVMLSTPPELLKELNPLMVYHNWHSPNSMNSMMAVEFNLTPVPFLSLYGQLGLDEFETPVEDAGGAQYRPTAIGWLLGVEGVLPLAGGYLTANWEMARTDPWLYNKSTDPRFIVTQQAWYQYIDPPLTYYVSKPIGYVWGPDSLVQFIRLGYRKPGLLAVSADLLLLTQGEGEIWQDYTPQEGDVSPTGVPEHLLRIWLHAHTDYFDSMEIGADILLAHVRNYSHIIAADVTDLELSFYLSYTI